jgi:hypothetical protein
LARVAERELACTHKSAFVSAQCPLRSEVQIDGMCHFRTHAVQQIQASYVTKGSNPRPHQAFRVPVDCLFAVRRSGRLPHYFQPRSPNLKE